MIGFVFDVLLRAVERVVHSIIKAGLIVSIVFSVFHYLGWFERIIWWIAERELSRNLGKAQITIGSFRIDWGHLLQGRVVIYGHNIIVHTPQRDLWQWDAPLIARVGFAEVDCTAPIFALHDVILKRPVPLEIYSVRVSDLQVFVERRQSIFNFYLLDNAMILPEPEQIRAVASINDGVNSAADANIDRAGEATIGSDSVNGDDSSSIDIKHSASLSSRQDRTVNEQTVEENASHVSDRAQPQKRQHLTEDKETDKDREKAQELVDEMLQAVKTLGKAARRGGLQGAIQQQGHNLADRLRDIQNNNNKEALEKGVKVMRQVGKVAAEQLAPKKLEQLVPQRKPLDILPPKARIGRIILDDVRLFTRDSWIQTNDARASTTPNDTPTATPGSVHSDTSPSKLSGWNKPITISQVIIRSSELCPPMSLVDEDGLPAVFQPVDRIGEVVWKRVVTEMAKSNTGRLFQTAFSEVLGYMKTTS